MHRYIYIVPYVCGELGNADVEVDRIRTPPSQVSSPTYSHCSTQQTSHKRPAITRIHDDEPRQIDSESDETSTWDHDKSYRYLPASCRTASTPMIRRTGGFHCKTCVGGGFETESYYLYYNSGGYDFPTKERHGFQGGGHGLVRIPVTSEASQKSEDIPATIHRKSAHRTVIFTKRFLDAE